jgi:hypothetical protein
MAQLLLHLEEHPQKKLQVVQRYLLIRLVSNQLRMEFPKHWPMWINFAQAGLRVQHKFPGLLRLKPL